MDFTLFTYQGIAIQEACWIDGMPYFTRRAIGEFLGARRPQDYIKKIVKRNPHIRVFSTGVNLSLVEGGRTITRDVEVYSPIGFQLILMRSNLPAAIEYQIAVAHLVYACMTGNLKPSKWTQKEDLVSAVRQILSLPCGRKRGALVGDLAERDGISCQTAYRRIQKASGQRLRTGVRSDKGTTKYPEERVAAVAYIKEHPGATAGEIKATLGLRVSVNRIIVWIRKYRLVRSDGCLRSVKGG